MAKFNELLSPRWNNVASRFLPVDEQEGVQTLSPDLQLVVDLLGRADLAYLLGERLAGGFAAPAAVAGQRSFLALRNPLGSNVLCILEQWDVITDGLRYQFGILDAAGTGVTTRGLRDGRYGTTRQPVCQITTGSALPASPQSGTFYTHAATAVERFIAHVVPPGLAFVIECMTVNTAFTGSLQWRERPVQPGELV